MTKYQITYHDANAELHKDLTVNIFDCKTEKDARHFFTLKFKRPKFRKCDFVITNVEKV